MKHEEFVDYMESQVVEWIDSGSYPELLEQHKGFKSTLQGFRETARFYDKQEKKMMQLLVEYSKGTLQALALVNAGGIFVIMTIVSGLLAANGRWINVVPWVAVNAKYFVVGISSAICAIIISYLAQTFYNENRKSEGRFFHLCAMLITLFSFVSFVYGAHSLMQVFVSEDFISLVRGKL